MISVISLYQTPFSMTKSSFQANPSGYTVAFNVYVGKIFWNYLWSTTHWRLWATIGHQLIVAKKTYVLPANWLGSLHVFFGMVHRDHLNVYGNHDHHVTHGTKIHKRLWKLFILVWLQWSVPISCYCRPSHWCVFFSHGLIDQQEGHPTFLIFQRQ
jgi:hypothetical protein